MSAAEQKKAEQQCRAACCIKLWQAGVSKPHLWPCPEELVRDGHTAHGTKLCKALLHCSTIRFAFHCTPTWMYQMWLYVFSDSIALTPKLTICANSCPLFQKAFQCNNYCTFKKRLLMFILLHTECIVQCSTAVVSQSMKEMRALLLLFAC